MDQPTDYGVAIIPLRRVAYMYLSYPCMSTRLSLYLRDETNRRPVLNEHMLLERNIITDRSGCIRLLVIFPTILSTVMTKW